MVYTQMGKEELANCSIGMATTLITSARAASSLRTPKKQSRTDRIAAAAYNVPREKRWALLGATEAGRILFVVYTHRHDDIRVITARDATDRQKRRYRKRGK